MNFKFAKMIKVTGLTND